MDNNDLGQHSFVDTTKNDMLRSEAAVTLMRNVYVWMAAALVITGLTAYLTVRSEALLSFIFSSSVMFWGLCIAEIVLVIAITAFINSLSVVAATLLFIVYSVVNGLTLSTIFMVYTFESIASTFFITAGMFVVMAIIGSFIKKDFSGWGRFFVMAIIGLIIASIVNLFLSSSALYWIITAVGVVTFAGLTAYDAQSIKRQLDNFDDVSDAGQKIAILGALSLYLDFINMFLYLLRIFGSRK